MATAQPQQGQGDSGSQGQAPVPATTATSSTPQTSAAAASSIATAAPPPTPLSASAVVLQENLPDPVDYVNAGEYTKINQKIKYNYTLRDNDTPNFRWRPEPGDEHFKAIFTVTRPGTPGLLHESTQIPKSLKERFEFQKTKENVKKGYCNVYLKKLEKEGESSEERKALNLKEYF